MKRRTVSIRVETYDALLAACTARDVSVSSVVEGVLSAWFALNGIVPAPHRTRASTRRPRTTAGKRTVEQTEAYDPLLLDELRKRFPIPSGNESTMKPTKPRHVVLTKRPAAVAF